MRTVRAELAAAVLRVAVLYAAIPGADRPDVDGPGWWALEAELEAAFDAGDVDRAREAIASWETHGHRVLAGSPGG